MSGRYSRRRIDCPAKLAIANTPALNSRAGSYFVVEQYHTAVYGASAARAIVTTAWVFTSALTLSAKSSRSPRSVLRMKKHGRHSAKLDTIRTGTLTAEYSDCHG